MKTPMALGGREIPPVADKCATKRLKSEREFASPCAGRDNRGLGREVRGANREREVRKKD